MRTWDTQVKKRLRKAPFAEVYTRRNECSASENVLIVVSPRIKGYFVDTAAKAAPVLKVKVRTKVPSNRCAAKV